MTPEELLRPRYKVIADYPNSLYKVGEIIECDSTEDCTLHNWPVIFKPLEWWEDRKPDQMPKYLRSSDKGRFYEVQEWCGENRQGKPLFKFFNNVNYLSTFCVIYYEPATHEEYTQYIESLKQTT